eukprot:4725131-Pyramimonas_sp.AAC.1
MFMARDMNSYITDTVGGGGWPSFEREISLDISLGCMIMLLALQMQGRFFSKRGFRLMGRPIGC